MTPSPTPGGGADADAASALDDVLLPDALARRPSRPADHAAEAAALGALAHTLATDPRGLLQRVVDAAMALCRAESAGVSILEPGAGPDGEDAFRWHATAGAFAPHANGVMPRWASPCGEVTARDAVLLFDRPGRHFRASEGVDPPIHEGLLAPWHVGGAAAGTLWVIHHAPGRHFDGEDARLLASLARFAAAAWQTVRALEAADAGRTELERRVAARTHELAEANAELRASEARARALVATLPGAAAFVVDRDLRYQVAEGEALRAAGFTPETFVGRAVAEVLEPALAAEYAPRFRQALAGAPFEVEHAAHGRVYLSRGVPLRDAAGRVTAALAVSVDVTAQRAAEAALRASEARLATIFAQASVGLSEVSPEGRFLRVNAELCRILGRPRDVLLALDVSAVTHPDDVAPTRAAVGAALAAAGPASLDKRYVRPDGTVVWASSSAMRLTDADGRPGNLLVVTVDISARKQAEATLRASEERQAFLLRLSDALQPLTDPVAIQEAAARVLGEHLGVDRAYYARVDWERGVAVIERDFFRGGARSIVGEHRVASVAGAEQAYRAGVLVLDDVVDARSSPPADLPAYRALQVRAVLSVPLVKQGVPVASMTLLDAAPHRWTDHEIALVEATAERTWAAVERARAEGRLRASEQAVRESEERLRLALRASGMGTFVWYPGEDRSDLDAQARALFGLPADGPPQRAAVLADIIHPDDGPGYAAAVARATDPRGDGALYHEFRIRRPADGLERWMAVTADAQFAGEPGDPARHAVRLTGVLADVTDRKRGEEALRASEARYRTLVEHVRDYAIFLLDAGGRVAEWTAGAERVKGYTAAEAVGQHVSRFYTPEDVAAGVPAAHLAQVAAEGRGEWEGWRVRRDGTRFWANEIATAVRDAEGRLAGYTKISRDLTERRLAAEAAEQARRAAARDALRRQLAQAEEAERRRLARELHDQLGQELTAFRLGLDDAARLGAALTAAARDGGRGAADAPDDAAPLLRRLAQLRALAERMTAGARYLALELRPPELDDLGLESALATYVAEWSARYGAAAEVAVTGAAGRAIPAEVSSALYRIAQEALTNVAKHAGATQVSVILEKPDGEVRLIVEDDGRGFDPEATAARVRSERRLGLAGMRERAALVGGTVAVESSPGGGTTVYVRLPVDHAPAGSPTSGWSTAELRSAAGAP